MTEAGLDPNVYLAIAAVGWADGQLDRDESDAIVRTALEDGMDFDAVQELELRIREPVEIGEIDWASMSKEDRLFVYAIASWLARLDRVVTIEEKDALDRLGVALNIPERPREHADSIAMEIAALPEGDRPFRMDVPGLRRTIGERLRAAQAARAERDG